MQQILAEAPENDNYGIDRMLLALGYEGIDVSRSSVYRTMKLHGLIHKRKRYPNGITREDAAVQKSENLIARDFHSDRPGKKLLTDITEIQCYDGKLYLAAVLDCFNGEIVGMAIEDNMKSELCVTAFENACKGYGYREMILHSDRGSQFTSWDFRQVLRRYDAVQSMSGTGRCYDNARMESFFATLKKELIYRMGSEHFPRKQVQSAIFRYINGYYNLRRIYTSNPHGLPPARYREAHLVRAA
jgi:transposase InsO family protein